MNRPRRPEPAGPLGAAAPATSGGAPRPAHSDESHQPDRPDARPTLAERAAAVPFWLYKRFFSPAVHSLGMGQCLYRPTCSEYAYVAVARFGPVRGGWLALGRLLRCHPWARGGFDPVPDRSPTADRLP